jgi:repressor LexA
MLVSNFADRLNEAIKLRHITPAEIVRRSEVLFEENKIFKPLTKPQMTNYLKGSYEAKQDNIYALSLILDVDEAWLIGCDVPMPRTPNELRGETKTSDDELLKKIGAIPLSSENMVNIPVLGTVKAGYDYLAQENWIGTIQVKAELIENGEEYFALKIKGDSMAPVFIEGDIVVIKKQNDCENNEYAVVIVNGEEGTLKKVKKTDSGIILQPLNPAYGPVMYTFKEMEDVPILIAGVVKQLQREF